MFQINICYNNLIFNSRNINKTEEEFNKVAKSWELLEKMINVKKIKKMRKNDEKILIKFFIDENNKDSLLKIFSQESYEHFLKEKNESNKINSKKHKMENKEEIEVKDKIENKEEIKIIDKIENKDKENKEQIENLKEILNYYNRYLFETKKEDIKLIENYINYGKGEINPEYLNELDNAKRMNNRFQIIKFIFNKKYKKDKGTETEYNQVVKSWETLEKMIYDKKIKKMKSEIKKILIEYFKDENNKKSLLKIFNEDSYEFFKNQKFEDKGKKENIDENKIKELKEILNYYNNYLFESKKEDIKKIEEIIKNKKGNYEEYIQKDLENARKMNDRFNIINFIFNSRNINKTEVEFNKVVKSWETYEKMISDKKIKKMRKNDEKILIKFFIEGNNKDSLLKIFSQETYEYFLKEKIEGHQISSKKHKIENKDKMDNKEQIKSLDNIENKDKENKEHIETINKINNKDKEIAEQIEKKEEMESKDKIENKDKQNKEQIKNKEETEIKDKIENKEELEKEENIENNKEIKGKDKVNKEKVENENKIENKYNEDNKDKEENKNIDLNSLILKLIENYNKDGNGNIKPEYLNDLENEKMNSRIHIIKYIFIEKYKDTIIQKSKNELNKDVQNWMKLEKVVNDKKIKNISSDLKRILTKLFNDENNKLPLLKIFNQDSYEFFISKTNENNKKKDNNNNKKEDKKDNGIIKETTVLKEIEDSKGNKDITEIEDYLKENNIIKEGEEIKENKEINIKNNDIIKKDELKEILNYYNNYFFESKIDDIKTINNSLEKSEYKMDYLEKYAKDLDEIKKKNIIYPIINLLYNSRYEGKIKIEEEFNKISNGWKDIEEMITQKKIKKMRKGDKKILIKYFNDEKNKDLLLKIFSQDSYEFFKKEGNENPNKNNLEIKEVLNYYKNFLFESKKKDIELIENVMKDFSIELNLEEYLKDLDVAKKMNNRYFIIERIYKSKYKDMHKKENKLNEVVKCWENYEKMINDKKFKKMRLHDQFIIFQSFRDINNKDLFLNIFKNDIIQDFIDDYLNKSNNQSYFNI